MIKLLLTNLDGNTEEVITPTLFPDGTSQCWKIDSISKNYRNCVKAEILWRFENESELIHVAQLSDLLDSYTGGTKPLKVLNIPFYPYGRQDKPITNTSTFAEKTFAKLVDSMKFDRVISFDVHGTATVQNLHNVSANNVIKKVFEDNGYDVYCYPDGGATERYLHEPSINGVKVRDHYTGKIKDYYLVTEYEDKTGKTHGVEVEGKKVLIVDDILDGGATFIELVKMIKTYNPGEIGLYTSHAIASKGYDHLIEAGITKFYTTNSLVKNEEQGIKIV